jgi:hypothetical protein
MTRFKPNFSDMMPKNTQPIAKKMEKILPAHAA